MLAAGWSLAIAAGGIRLIVWDLQRADEARLVGASGSSPWAGVATDASLLLPVAIGLLAVMSLWQDGWGRARLLGPARRLSVWALAMASLGGVAFVLTVPWDPMTAAFDLTQRALAATPLALVFVSSAFLLRRSPYRDVPRRQVVVAALVLGALLGTLTWWGAARVSREGRAYEASLAANPTLFFPPQNIVCAGVITTRCAQVAADRANGPVVWLPTTNSPHVSLVAIPSAQVRVVIQHVLFEGTLGALEIMSPAVTGPPESPVIRTIHAHGLTASVRRPVTDEPLDEVFIDWTYRGRLYVMTATAVFHRFTAEQIDELAQRWTTLRYTLPS